jgi:hypothetical protein
VILRAIEADEWKELGQIAQSPPTKNRPRASYRVHEGSVRLDGKACRAVVVHSSALDQRRFKCLQRELNASRSDLEAMAKAEAKKTFFCRADAEAAAAQLRACRSPYHQLQVRVEEHPRYGPRPPQEERREDPCCHRVWARDCDRAKARGGCQAPPVGRLKSLMARQVGFLVYMPAGRMGSFSIVALLHLQANPPLDQADQHQGNESACPLQRLLDGCLDLLATLQGAPIQTPRKLL